MNRLRVVDPDAFDRSAYATQRLWFGESCAIIASLVPAGKPAYRHHRHEHSNQLYYVVEGEMHVQVGETVHIAGPDTVVYIPKGVAHHNWNEGDVDEFHVEVIAPCPFPALALATPTDDIDADHDATLVRRLDPDAFVQSARFAGFSLNRSVLPDGHCDALSLYVGEVAPGAGGPGLHVHDFDQFYYVLSGALHVQVGLETSVAAPGTLVTLPAGVPHRQWNEGTEIERHLAVLVPSPTPGKPLDVGVSLALSGETID